MDLPLGRVRIQPDLGGQGIAVVRRGFVDENIIYHEDEFVFGYALDGDMYILACVV